MFNWDFKSLWTSYVFLETNQRLTCLISDWRPIGDQQTHNWRPIGDWQDAWILDTHQRLLCLIRDQHVWLQTNLFGWRLTCIWRCIIVWHTFEVQFEYKHIFIFKYSYFYKLYVLFMYLYWNNVQYPKKQEKLINFLWCFLIIIKKSIWK